MRVTATEDKRLPVKAAVRTVKRHLITTERTSLQDIKMCVGEACRLQFLDGLIMVVWEHVNDCFRIQLKVKQSEWLLMSLLQTVVSFDWTIISINIPLPPNV